MAKAKKKATAKAVQPKPSDTRKLPGAKSAHRSVTGSAGNAPGSKKQVKEKKLNKQSVNKSTAKKKTTAKKGATAKKAQSNGPESTKPASRKASINPDSAKTSQKLPVDRGTNTRHSPKAEIVKKAREKAKVAQIKTDKKVAAKQQPVNKKAEEIKADSSKQSESGAPSRVKGKKQDSEFNDSSGQGMAKSGQKKRGWRDIEALTERARLKSLLSDIWHEDIDLDSDIFGETDHLYGYYTDKEEVEIEPEKDEEWEEFEEDED